MVGTKLSMMGTINEFKKDLFALLPNAEACVQHNSTWFLKR